MGYWDRVLTSLDATLFTRGVKSVSDYTCEMSFGEHYSLKKTASGGMKLSSNVRQIPPTPKQNCDSGAPHTHIARKYRKTSRLGDTTLVMTVVRIQKSVRVWVWGTGRDGGDEKEPGSRRVVSPSLYINPSPIFDFKRPCWFIVAQAMAS